MALLSREAKDDVASIIIDLPVSLPTSGYAQTDEDGASAHDRLKKNEERYRLAMEATNDGLWDLEVGTDNCYFSQGCFRMLGYIGDEQKAGLDWLSIVHPLDLGRARTMFFDCVAGKVESFEIEFRIKTKKGSWKWILIRGKATARDHEGKGLRMVGTFVDISERKHMEEMLRMEHNLLELITSTSPVGIMFVNRGGEIVFTNPRTEQILGISRETILRQRLGGDPCIHQQVEAPGLSALEERSLGKVLKTGEQIRNECFTFERPDGQRLFLSLNAAPFFDNTGQIGGTVATLEDVTERTLSEQALSDNAWLLRESQRIAMLGSYVLNLRDLSRKISGKIQEILGIDQDFPLELESYLRLIHPEFVDIYLEALEAAFTNGRRLEIEYKIIRRCDGNERWVAEFGEIHNDGAGGPDRLIGTLQDITERKAAEEAIRNLNDDLDRRVAERTSQLDAAKKEIESFSYSVSHDLRAPLRHINSYSSLLVEDFGDQLPEEAKLYLERIGAASSRMGTLIDDLLKLSKVSRTEMKHNSFSISRVAQEVAEMLRSSEPDREVEFVIGQGLTAKGDGVLVRLVLENLMQNAMKYSSKRDSARIEFDKTQVKGRNAFFVRDNGVGFDMSYSDKLFQPFQRLHGTEFEGTGIGLATVKKIVERHGGCVWAEGALEQGSTFFFTLPEKSRRY